MAAPRYENLKEIILDAAEEMLKEKNAAEISLAQIAEKAGVSKGTLYYYYKNKNLIFFDITDRYLSRQWEELILWTEDKSKDTSPHRLIKYIMERDIAGSALRIHLLEAALSGDEEIRTKLIERYSEFKALISQKIFERTDRVSADYLTWILLLTCDGIVVQNSLCNTEFDSSAFIEQSAQYIKQMEEMQ